MRILLISDDLPPEILGGSGRVVLETSAELVRRGHVVTILTASNYPVWPDPPLGVDVRVISRLGMRWAHYRSVFSVSLAREIAKHICDINPDVIHAHGLAWQIGYRWMDDVIRRRIPCFYTVHGMMHVAYGKVLGDEPHLWWNDFKRARWTLNPFRNGMIRRRMNRITAMLCVSDALRTYLLKYGFTTLRTLHNGIDLRFWSRFHSQVVARTQLDFPPHVPMFLLAGRLGHDKGLNLMLDIWRDLPDDVHLVLAGSLAPQFRFTDPRIHVLPQQSPEQMRLLYNAVDVNLVPSLCFDCFPTTSLESMACGTPVLVSNRGGGKEAIIDGETGWVIDPRDRAEVFSKIVWCLDHRGELPHMGEKARLHLEQNFSLDTHIEKLLAMYEGAMGRA